MDFFYIRNVSGKAKLWIIEVILLCVAVGFLWKSNPLFSFLLFLVLMGMALFG